MTRNERRDVIAEIESVTNDRPWPACDVLTGDRLNGSALARQLHVFSLRLGGMTQADIARRWGISTSRIAELERKGRIRAAEFSGQSNY